MKIFTRIISTFLLISVSHLATKACSCDFFEPTFCKNISGFETIVRATIIDSISYAVRKIKVIENIEKEINEEIALILGQDGLNCGQWLNEFELNDTLILAVRKIQESPYWYLHGLCGPHYLRYQNGMVIGPITDLLSEQPYDEFIENIMECIELTINNGSSSKSMGF